MFGGSSQLPNTAERAVIKSLSTDQSTKQCSAVIQSLAGREIEHLIDGNEKRICQLSFELHVTERRGKHSEPSIVLRL